MTNMWKQVPVEQREELIAKSLALLTDIEKFTKAMMYVIDSWIYSSEANLTANINHQAWLGQAACAIEHNAPEDLTKLAWAMMTKEQQEAANIAADNVKTIWVNRYAGNS